VHTHTSIVTQSADNKPALTATALTLTLGAGDGATAILKGIDLTVPQGQVLAILGPSGSGKSSLMAVLSGLERAKTSPPCPKTALRWRGAGGSAWCCKPFTCCPP